MDFDIEKELEELRKQVAIRQRHIEDQVFLISILESDGHHPLEQHAALKTERKRLAEQMERQVAILRLLSTDERAQR
ncbi:hypothetical protein [Bradyrhizobium sp. MOS002]|uniref:hypothetical protein n=1 Tax=Bradyrhizobium sp. MOS002 TaxID=2133947 RepID=UPI0011B1FF50|nr:hypothetical protein [Bradyrhizobium sp. MOS002]